MKAFIVTHYGPDGLRSADVPTPIVGPRDVLVDMRAASINPLDTLVRNGEFKQLIKAVWQKIQSLDLPDTSTYAQSATGMKMFVQSLTKDAQG